MRFIDWLIDRLLVRQSPPPAPPAPPPSFAELAVQLGTPERAAARAALVQLGAAGVPELLGLLRSGGEGSSVAGIALAEIGAPSALEELLALAADSRPEVRRGALHALAQLRDPRVLPALVAALDDGDALVEIAACEALRGHADPAAIPALARRLRRSGGVFTFAGIALGSFGERALPELIAAVREGYAHELMAETLKQIPAAVPPLIAMLDDPATPRPGRITAARLLGSLQAPGAVPALLRALQSDDDELAEVLATALAVHGAPEALAALRDPVASPAPWARIAAAYTLRDIPALSGMMREGDGATAEGAAFALAVIGNRPARGALVAALEDATREVRVIAAYALGIGDGASGSRRPGDQTAAVMLATLATVAPEARAAAAAALSLPYLARLPREQEDATRATLEVALRDAPAATELALSYALGRLRVAGSG